MQDEAYLADLILKDIKQMEELAKSEGVRAYLRKPQKRVKTTPNRNFLQKTLLNVAYRNQKTEEELLWKAREKQLDIKRSSKRKQLERRDRRLVAALDDRLRSKRTKSNKTKHVRNEDQKLEQEEFDRRGRGGSEDCEDFIGPQPIREVREITRTYGPQKPSYLDRCSRHC